MDKQKRTAIVTGGNRGIGFEVCRQLALLGYRVVLTSRKVNQGLEAVEQLKREGGEIVFRPLDVTSQRQIKDLKHYVERYFGGADVLVIHVNMTVILGFRHVDMLGKIIRAALRQQNGNQSRMHIALVLRTDGDVEAEGLMREYRRQAVASGVPVFDELAPAAKALLAMRTVEAFRVR